MAKMKGIKERRRIVGTDGRGEERFGKGRENRGS